MAALNKVQIIGNVGKDPEVRTAGSSQVANFSVAVTEKYKAQDGTQKEQTEWFTVQAWGKLAEICGRFLKKGSPVYIEGKMRTRSWDDTNGQKQYRTELVAEQMQMLGGAQSGGNNQGAPQSRAPQEPPPNIPGFEHTGTAPLPEDDLPF